MSACLRANFAFWIVRFEFQVKILFIFYFKFWILYFEFRIINFDFGFWNLRLERKIKLARPQIPGGAALVWRFYYVSEVRPLSLPTANMCRQVSLDTAKSAVLNFYPYHSLTSRL